MEELTEDIGPDSEVQEKDIGLLLGYVVFSYVGVLHYNILIIISILDVCF